MEQIELSSVKEYDEDLNDVKEPNKIISKIYQNDMVSELIADWYNNQFNEFNVFMADYLNYLVWYVYKKKKCKKMSKDEFLCYLDGLSQNSVVYRLYQSFINETIYKKDMEQQIFLLIDEINPLKINKKKTMDANGDKYEKSNEFKKYLVDLYKTIKLQNNSKISFHDFFTGNQNAIENKIRQDFPKLAEKLDNLDFDLYKRCQNIIYNRNK